MKKPGKKTKKATKVKKAAKPRVSAKAKRGPAARRKRDTRKRRAPRLNLSAFYATSERLGFRLLDAGDVDLYCDIFTDAKTMEFIGPPLTRERAEASFKKALEVTLRVPVEQRISVIVELASGEGIGIASLKMLDADRRRAEGGLVLKASAHSQRFATEGGHAMIAEAFKRHSIDELTTRVPTSHKINEKLVATIGYSRQQELPVSEGKQPMALWSVTRETWVRSSQRSNTLRR